MASPRLIESKRPEITIVATSADSAPILANDRNGIAVHIKICGWWKWCSAGIVLPGKKPRS